MRKKIKVGVVRGYANPKIFEDSGMDRQIVNNNLQNLRILIRKRVDLILIDKIQAKYLINTKIQEQDRDELVWIEPPIQVNEQYLVICKNTPQARKKVADFNKGLKVITEKGRVDTILREHKMR